MSPEATSPDEQIRLALAAYQEGRLEDALERFAHIRASYLAEGDHAMAAEMANNMAVAFLQADQPHQALEIVQDTPAIFLAQDDRLRAAQAYGNLGSALEACDARQEAEDAYRQAIALFTEVGASEQHATTLQALSRLQLQRGQPFDALTSMQNSLEIKPRTGLKDRLLRRLLNLPQRFMRQ